MPMLKYIVGFCFSVLLKVFVSPDYCPKNAALACFFWQEYKKWLPQAYIFGIIGYFCIMLHALGSALSGFAGCSRNSFLEF